MTKIVSLISAFGLALGVVLHSGAAAAQATRTSVSGAGDDTNPCTRASNNAFAGNTSDGSPTTTIALK